MRRVKQRDNKDCGVACVAMLADISYESAFDKVYENGKVDHTEICDLKRALVSLGLKTAYRTVKIEKNNLEKLAVNAIVKTAPRRDGIGWFGTHKKRN
jgi:ABC-type bacteriocin/lantibiotic exporter with double-glycine peptidase domain